MQVARVVDVRDREQLMHHLPFRFGLGAPALMIGSFIASATEDERYVKALGVSCRTFNNTASNIFPEHADEVTICKEFALELRLFFRASETPGNATCHLALGHGQRHE